MITPLTRSWSHPTVIGAIKASSEVLKKNVSPFGCRSILSVAQVCGRTGRTRSLPSRHLSTHMFGRISLAQTQTFFERRLHHQPFRFGDDGDAREGTQLCIHRQCESVDKNFDGSCLAQSLRHQQRTPLHLEYFHSGRFVVIWFGLHPTRKMAPPSDHPHASYGITTITRGDLWESAYYLFFVILSGLCQCYAMVSVRQLRISEGLGYAQLH